MKRLLLAPLLLGFIPFANANVSPEVHNLCKDVSDYVGCVKANSSKRFIYLPSLIQFKKRA